MVVVNGVVNMFLLGDLHYEFGLKSDPGHFSEDTRTYSFVTNVALEAESDHILCGLIFRMIFFDSSQILVTSP